LKAGYHQTEDEILAELIMVKASQKKPEAFQSLYDKYFDVIFNFIFRRTGEEEITADLVSQTFLKALQNLKKYEFKGIPFSAWLYKIAGNEINKYYKKSNKAPIYSIESDLIINLFEESEEENLHDEKIKILINELQKLSPEDLNILELRFFEDKSFKEIAFILEIRESTAKMRTYRAIEKLKSNITNKRRSGYDQV
jgi:RNA polymerase sigma-70 factor, ECF subfamily